MALIKKSNDLIQANYNLSLNEQRLIYTLCSTIQRTDKDFENYEFTLTELAELTKIDKKFIYAEIENIALSLSSKPIVFIREDVGKLICNWCSSFDFNEKINTVKICFDPKLKPYLLELKKCFTAYDKKYIEQFKSKYSFRLYELCKQYQSIKKRKISIVSLKSFLNIENKYHKIAALKAYIINPAIKEINEHSDLLITTKYKKTRRSITDIEFTIENKLANCQSEKQEKMIVDEVNKQEQTRRTQAEQKNKTEDRTKIWDAMSDEDKQKNYPGARGFAKFMAGFAKKV